jgi:GT2 family glycosyltransferase
MPHIIKPCALVVLDVSGLLDEDFFLYAEEAELKPSHFCSRLKMLGNYVSMEISI